MIARVERESYNNIDLIKLCMAVLVVAIHTSLFDIIVNDDVRQVIRRALSIIVPFFFVASGFLLWNKIWNADVEVKLARIRGWIKKTARLYCVWTLIYIPFTIYGFHRDGLGVIKSIALFTRNFLLVGENYLSWPLWYLLGMLVAGCLVYLMVKWHWRSTTMYMVGFLFAALGVFLAFCITSGLYDAVTSIYVKLFKTTKNGVFEGLPYITIGILIASNGVIKSKKTLLILLIVSFLFHMFGYKIATFVVVYSLFSLVIKFDVKKRSDNLYTNLRLASTVVYFVHMIWVGIISILFPDKWGPGALFIVVVMLCFATTGVVLNNKETRLVRLLFR